MPADARPTILHLLNTLDGGGTERGLLSLLYAFDRTRFRHVVITLRNAGRMASALPDDVACRAMGACVTTRCLGVAIARIAKQENARILHARNTCCWADATLSGILAPHLQLVLSFHGLEHAGRFSLRDRMVTALARCISADFTSVSESGRKKMISELGIPSKRVHTLPNGVSPTTRDKTRDHRCRIRESFGLAPSDFVIGTVGSLTPVKRHDLLLSALSELHTTTPHARLLLIGDGPCRDALTASCHHLGLDRTVIFAGWRDDVETCLDAMDVYACTSDSEGMSHAVLEALSNALPTVATHAGDNALVIRHGVDGLIVPCGDSSAIASSLHRIATDSHLQHRLSTAAWHRSERYGLDRTARRYEWFYETIFRNQRRPIAPRGELTSLTSA